MSIILKGKENKSCYHGRYASLDNSNSNSFHYNKEYIGDEIVYTGHFMYHGCRIKDGFKYCVLNRTGEGSNTAFGKYTMKKNSKDNWYLTEFTRFYKKRSFDGNDSKESKKICLEEEEEEEEEEENEYYGKEATKVCIEENEKLLNTMQRQKNNLNKEISKLKYQIKNKKVVEKQEVSRYECHLKKKTYEINELKSKLHDQMVSTEKMKIQLKEKDNEILDLMKKLNDEIVKTKNVESKLNYDIFNCSKNNSEIKFENEKLFSSCQDMLLLKKFDMKITKETQEQYSLLKEKIKESKVLSNEDKYLYHLLRVLKIYYSD